MTFPIDQSVYPDRDDPPRDLPTIFDKADYVHRICTAWDFGIHPEPVTFKLFASWKDVFDKFPVATSPGYHAFRMWFQWEPVPFPPDIPAPVPRWLDSDRLEQRPPDPCDSMI